jgi:hypothetical protein
VTLGRPSGRLLFYIRAIDPSAGQHLLLPGMRWGGRVAVRLIDPGREDMMRAQGLAHHQSATCAERIPITPAAFRWLEREVDRLAAMVDDESSTAWMKSMSGDSDAPTFIANGDFELLVRRLGKLRAAIVRSQITRPNGSAMVGTRVTVRTEDGLIESYVLVSPGAADARGSSISPESPVGAALMGRLPRDTVHVATPAGTLSLRIISVVDLSAEVAQPLHA